MIKCQDTLPGVPSELVRVALDDLKTCIKTGVKVAMGTWYITDPDLEKCSVCLAGAVMRESLNIKPDQMAAVGFPPGYELSPSEVGAFSINMKLRALNSFRVGRLCIGLQEMGFACPDGLLGSVHVSPYRTHPEEFFEDMEEVIRILQSYGL